MKKKVPKKREINLSKIIEEEIKQNSIRQGFSKNLIKYAPSLFNRSGQYNFSGYMVQTLIFGLSVYGVTKLTKTLSDI